ncbi:MAG TPA: hypothetical protein VI893_08420, partial [Thermoplasmata archaeon]|nr:hypothetical protein [Thermoplasmata archaeon]
VALSADDSAQFTAAGTDAYGNPVAVAPQWGTSGGTISGSGLYAAGPVGAWTVYGNQSGVGDTAVVTVTAGKAVTMRVEPAVATVRADKTLKLTAEAADSDSNQVAISPSWSTTGGAVGAAGLFTPDKVGDYVVTATDGTLSASSSVKVTPGALYSLSLDPTKVILKVGESADLAISAADIKANAIAGFSAKWSSTNLGTFNGSAGSWKFAAKSVGKSTVKVDVTSEGVARSADLEITVEEKPVVPGVGGLGGVMMVSIIAIALVAVIALVAALLLARKKRRPAQDQNPFYGQEPPASPPGF